MRLHYIASQLMPTSCCVCRNFGHHRLANLCETCQLSCQGIQFQCARCALPLEQASRRCGNCLKHPPAFDAAFSAFLYQPPVSLLIPGIKNGVDQTALPALSELFCEQLASRFSWQVAAPTTILPIPLHWRRYLDRGFNQSLAFGRYLGNQLKLPVASDILKRVRHAVPQHGLKRSVRLRNLKSAFVATQEAEGRSFIIVDDVMTTGATMDAAAKALKAAGATSVVAWSLARTARL